MCLDAQLSHIAQRLLERRPALGLIRCQFQARLQRGDARVGEGGDVGNARPMTVLETRTAVPAVANIAGCAKTLLRVNQRRAGESKIAVAAKSGLNLTGLSM